MPAARQWRIRIASIPLVNFSTRAAEAVLCCACTIDWLFGMFPRKRHLLASLSNPRLFKTCSATSSVSAANKSSKSFLSSITVYPSKRHTAHDLRE